MEMMDCASVRIHPRHLLEKIAAATSQEDIYLFESPNLSSRANILVCA